SWALGLAQWQKIWAAEKSSWAAGERSQTAWERGWTTGEKEWAARDLMVSELNDEVEWEFQEK
ncbi:hypothetical protein U1Q18_025204, partial [Sarracenia purpurea var. burkii]